MKCSERWVGLDKQSFGRLRACAGKPAASAGLGKDFLICRSFRRGSAPGRGQCAV